MHIHSQTRYTRSIVAQMVKDVYIIINIVLSYKFILYKHVIEIILSEQAR